MMTREELARGVDRPELRLGNDPEQPQRCEIPSWIHDFACTAYFAACSCSRCGWTRYFCIDCSRPMCDSCRCAHAMEHRFIQVRRASHRDCVDLNDAGDHLETRGIQTYTNNHKPIIFLRGKPRSDGEARSTRGWKKPCLGCGKSSLSAKAKFCSITCKIHPPTPCSKRVHRRKGIPHRAPM